jgi:hypothetical protein
MVPGPESLNVISPSRFFDECLHNAASQASLGCIVSCGHADAVVGDREVQSLPEDR